MQGVNKSKIPVSTNIMPKVQQATRLCLVNPHHLPENRRKEEAMNYKSYDYTLVLGAASYQITSCLSKSKKDPGIQSHAADGSGYM